MTKRIALTLLIVSWATFAHGATQLFSENFEGPNPLSNDFDQTSGGNCNAVAISTSQTHGGTYSLYYTPNGHDTTGDCNHGLPGTTKFYVSMWIWTSPTINPCYAPGHHMWRVSTPDVHTGGGVKQFDVVVNSGTAAGCATGPVVVTLDPLFGGDEPGSGTGAYVHAAELERGAWTRIEVLFDEGTPGGADGSLMVWYTDSAGLHAWPTHGGVPDTGRSYASGSSASVMDTYKVVTNFDGAGPGDYWYTDDVEVWDSCPPSGAACSGTHTADTTPPVRSAGAPSGALPMGTTQTALSLSTNEAATCRYATTPGIAYASMTKNFTTTGQTSHAVTVTGLTNGGAYNYYVRCLDAAGNANQDDYNISFSVSTTVPVSSCASPPPGTIFCDDFENTTTPLTTTYTDYDSGGGRFVSTTSEAHSGTHAMSARYDPGVEQSGYLWYNFGRNPAGSKTQTSTDFTEIYWRVWMKVQTGFQGNPQKFTRARVLARSDYTDAASGHVWQGSSSNLALDPATGVASDGTTLMTSGYNDFAHYTWLGLAEGATQVYDSSHQGRWQCIEAHIKLNTPGQSDGVFELWVDGNLDAQRTGLNWRGSFTAYGLNHVTLENWWNGGVAPKTEYRYFDDFMLSTQRIGCGSGGTDTTPPQNVTQLRRGDRH